ncbi:MAG TPA: biopolymer transporter ExbD [Phycisphaerales bacterium]|nr:biopolymer transporter ExbD [Phycisphaerales bacterium]
MSPAPGSFPAPIDPQLEAIALDEAEHIPVRSRRRRRYEAAPMMLNITAMIDVIFLLLTYFLMLASFRPREQSMETEAPKPAESGALTAQTPAQADPFELPSVPIRVTVVSGGDGPEQCAIATDSPALGEIRGVDDLFTKAGAARGPLIAQTQSFVIRPDADARWEHALAVLNALRRAGYDQVTFAHPAGAGGTPGSPNDGAGETR